ncbi:MAG TPA: hypothetical protein VIJ57_13200 [Hanamia sp.]
MKNLSTAILLLFVSTIFLFTSCNNNKEKKTPTYNEVNVKNVNGNIPDTTNAIDLSTRKTDSANSTKDTTQQH